MWDDIISMKREIGTSRFQLVYGLDVVFHASLGLPVIKYVQEEEAETNEIQRIINQLIEMQQVRDGVCDMFQIMQEIMKMIFDRKVKGDDFKIGDLVSKWNARYEEKGKHGKFDHLWQGPYNISAFSGKNAYFLEDVDGNEIGLGPVNDRFLRHYPT